jgi:hypothetical protein
MPFDAFDILSLEVQPHGHFVGTVRVVWPGRGPQTLNVYCIDGVIYCGPGDRISSERFNTADLELAVQTVLRARLLEYCPGLNAIIRGEAGQ